MVFVPPSWVPSLPAIPDSITVDQFMNTEAYGCRPFAKSRNPYTCGMTGRTYSSAEVADRVDFLARGLRKKLNIFPNEGTEWDRVAALFCVNTIDFIPFTHAIHRLNGIVTPASAAFSAAELEYQLRASGAKSIFTCTPLLPVALEAAAKVGIPKANILLMPVPGHVYTPGYTTLDDLIKMGKTLPENEPLQWIQGQGARQVAYMCFSSGTSGLPKAVMLSHVNIIANIMQMTLFDAPGRKEIGVETQVSLGLLPLTHIYGLTLVAHVAQFRGDELVILPKFELNSFLKAIERFRIEMLFVVPPILMALLANPIKADQTDLRSVRMVMCGAAPLGREVQENVNRKYPRWRIMQGYGMTEASPLVTINSETDILIGSSGSLIPGVKAKLVDLEGKEITEYEKPGEMLVQGPNVVLGYLNNEKANTETFVHHADGRWLRSGDEVVVRVSANGNEHFAVVDRIKELIKVKGHQVAPAELEAHLLNHPAVGDCCVISVPDARDGEAAKAFVVKAENAEGTDETLAEAISAYVREHKAKHKWLKGGVEFIETIPKSPSGKILRRVLRDQDKAKRRATSARL